MEVGERESTWIDENVIDGRLYEGDEEVEVELEVDKRPETMCEPMKPHPPVIRIVPKSVGVVEERVEVIFWRVVEERSERLVAMIYLVNEKVGIVALDLMVFDWC